MTPQMTPAICARKIMRALVQEFGRGANGILALGAFGARHFRRCATPADFRRGLEFVVEHGWVRIKDAGRGLRLEPAGWAAARARLGSDDGASADAEVPDGDGARPRNVGHLS